MKKLFGKKSKELEESKPKKEGEETSLVDVDYNRKKLFKKSAYSTYQPFEEGRGRARFPGRTWLLLYASDHVIG